jgi:predicted phage tail protein
MRLLLVLLTLSLAVGTAATVAYVAVVVEPAVWSACVIWLSFSAGARIVLGGVAVVVAAKHPPLPAPDTHTTLIDKAVFADGDRQPTRWQ